MEKTKQYNYKELFLFHLERIGFYEKQKINVESTAFIAYKKAFEVFEESWDHLIRKRASYELKQAERQRQRIYACFMAAVRGGEKHPDDAISGKALHIEQMLSGLTGLNPLCSLRSEEEFQQIVYDLKEEAYRPVLLSLGAYSWLEELSHLDESTQDLQKFHVDELLNGKYRVLKKQRLQLEQSYQALLKELE